MKRNDRRRILTAVSLAALTLFLCGCSGTETAAGNFAALPSASTLRTASTATSAR